MTQKINDDIRLAEVVVISDDGTSLGKYKLGDALAVAEERGLDLVLVNEPNGICKLMNYEKFTYERSKKEKENRKPKHSDTIKEFKFGAHIGPHDIDVKVKKIIATLEDQYQVKLSVFLRGRDLRYKPQCVEMIKEIYQKVTGNPPVEGTVRVSDNSIFALISPVKQKNEAQL